MESRLLGTWIILLVKSHVGPSLASILPWGPGLGGPWAPNTLLPLALRAGGPARAPVCSPAFPSTSTCDHASWPERSAQCHS